MSENDNTVATEEQPKQSTEELQKQITTLSQQNNTLRTILQTLIPLLDKFQRSQSSQISGITNGIEQFLQNMDQK